LEILITQVHASLTHLTLLCALRRKHRRVGCQTLLLLPREIRRQSAAA
jgi:hypothetical protein